MSDPAVGSRGGVTGTAAGNATGGSGAAPLSVVRPDWSAPAHVTAFCTTRDGGVSAPPYDSLNLGLHVGDDEAHVRENRARVVAGLALPSAPVWLSQVHGTRVVRIRGDGLPDERDREGYPGRAAGADERGERDASTGTDEPDRRKGSVGARERGERDGSGRSREPEVPIEADGAWTDVPGRVVAVMTADCLPVVLTDAVGSAVAVAHAGWRGLAAGVLASALEPFAADAVVHAWLGPAIGPRAFEVGEEVREAFVGRDAAHEGAFVQGDAPGKYLADLYALARHELRRAHPDGILHIDGGDRCTFTEAPRFHSHRRDGAASGRMATLAWLTPPER